MNGRRHILKGLAALTGAAVAPRILRAAAPPLPEYPFKLGIASGFPTDRSVVLWTRLAPEPAAPSGGMPPADVEVRYEVAGDESFRRILARGSATAVPGWAHSIHVEVQGLEPARDYWYRFTAGDHASPVGRTRTLPSPDARVDAFTVALASCQHYEHGHYAAWRHVAADAPQLVVHLGDYIYETGPSQNRVRRHTGGRCTTLEDYRQRYALYQADPALQAAHLAAPFVFSWDDHEVENNYSGDRPGRETLVEGFLARRAAAYQAWYEHLPVPSSFAPRDSAARIHSRVQLGRLATLHLLDQRQFRSPQACPQLPRLGGYRIPASCTERLDPARTILGAEQERWLARGLQDHPARWTLFGTGTVFAHMDERMAGTSEYWSDGWDGYPAARQRLIDALLAARSENPLFLGGDIHAFVVAGVNARPEDPDSPLVAAEFTGTSISSDPIVQPTLDHWKNINPHMRLLDGNRRGYLRLALSERRARADLVTVDDSQRPDSGSRVGASFVVEAGNPAILSA